MKLRVVYDKVHVGRPVLASVVAKTKVLVNILEAKVSPKGGEVVVDVPDDHRAASVVEAFREEGVAVEELKQHILIDLDRCIACGACVSPCPVRAIKVEGSTVEVDEARCVRCQACVWACPMRAIRLL